MRSALVRDALAISAAVGVFGVSFGVLAESAGLSVLQSLAMSLLVFTGASQFAAISVIASGGSAGAAVGSALMLAARNMAYGLTLAPLLPSSRVRRALAAQWVVDETAAMALAQEQPGMRRRAFWITGALEFSLWNAGTLTGALIGQGVASPERLGLDVAFPAAFVALVAPQLRHPRARAAAVVGVALALVLVPVAPIGLPVVAAAGGAVIVGLRRRATVIA